jgi:hypothetical protein
MDIADWQRLLELPQYIPALAEKAIDWTVLPRLTADDLPRHRHRRGRASPQAVGRDRSLPQADSFVCGR